MNDDLHGFKKGEHVELRCSFSEILAPLRGYVMRPTSGEGRLLIEVRRNGRRLEVAVRPADLRRVAP